MDAYFVGRGEGVMGAKVARTSHPHYDPILPRVGEKVRLAGNLFVVDDIHHDYERREIRVYLMST